MESLDIFCDRALVGTLVVEQQNGVFTYLPGTNPANLVSLLMPVRHESYKWLGGVMPIFRAHLPEGLKKEAMRQTLGLGADLSEMGLLALIGSNIIGRVSATPRGTAHQASGRPLDMLPLLASTNSAEALMRSLGSRPTDGISGMMAKNFASSIDSGAAYTGNFILKTSPPDKPGLAINEYLCLQVAKHAGLNVPDTRLSEDGQVLAIRRFDISEHGGRVGVEDFCALLGYDSAKKYQGRIEDLVTVADQYLGAERRREDKQKLFSLLLLNYALRNGAAHMKSYALTYTNQRDARLAPVYGTSTTTVYEHHRDDTPALTLNNRKLWRSGYALFALGSTRLSLTKSEMMGAYAQVSIAVQTVIPLLKAYAERFSEFRLVGDLMLSAWKAGLKDIKYDAKPIATSNE